jgi:hypothetical protein
MVARMLSQLVRSLKRRLLLAYDLHAEAWRLDRMVGRFTPDPSPVNEDFETAAVVGAVPDIAFLVATTHAGLLLVEGTHVTRLFRGRDFYGITTTGERWYVYHRFSVGNGCIISFRLQDGHAIDARTELAGLLRGVHQIDVIDDSMWIVDTFHDRIIVVPLDSIGDRWRERAALYYPVGRSGIGRERPNHAHFNSVLGRQGDIYLVAHYEGAKTGRDSELFLLDSSGTVRGREPMGGSDCHNIGFLDGERVFCRSKEGAVCKGGQDVLRLDGYVRGLALGHDFHIVGTSTMGRDWAQRAQGDGSVVITDRAFAPLATMVLPRTQVCEVRRVDAPDLGLSSSMGPRSDD